MSRYQRVKWVMSAGVLVALAFFAGWRARLEVFRKQAENQAIWLARTWVAERPFTDVLREAEELGHIHLSSDEWQAGDGEDIAFGPVVDGQRMCIRKDRSVYCRPLR